MTFPVRPGNGAKGRECGLSTSTFDLEGDAPATGGGLDHPLRDRWLVHENAFFLPVRADCVTSDTKRLMSVVRHVACLQDRIMGKIAVPFRKLLQKVDRVFDARYLSHQILSLLQIDRAIKHLRDHFYLTENVDDQQGWRMNRAPADDLFSASPDFKILRKEALKFFVGGDL